MQKTLVLSFLVLLAACASDPPVTETGKTQSCAKTVPVIVATSTVPQPRGVSDREPDLVRWLPLDNVGLRPLWFLKSDLFGFVISAERDVRLRLRIVINNDGNMAETIVDTQQDVQVWRTIPAEIALPVNNAYEIPGNQRRMLKISVWVLTKSRQEPVTFDLQLGGFQCTKPKPNEDGSYPAMPTENVAPSPGAPAPSNNDDPRGMREF